MLPFPMVSIIIPVYKSEKYFQECLNSVANQTFTDWECIVVDDGSDQPELIDTITAETLMQKGRVIHQKNKGVSNARNTGIEAAQGKFIVCLDSDDYIHPEFLAKTTAAIETNSNAGVIYCWTQYVGDLTDSLRPSELHLFWLLQRNYITITSLFKKKIWSELGGFDEVMKIGHEDWEFWIRTSLANHKFLCVPEILFYYRISKKSRNIEATAKRFNTINYVRHKHSDVYFQPLYTLLSCSCFQSIAKPALLRFWITGLFFRYLPLPIRRLLFNIYRCIADRPDSQK
jgi:glycosyltransferase involved in cell wall biosynthesis